MAEFLGAVNLIQGEIVHFLGSSELNHLSSVHHRQAVAADQCFRLVVDHQQEGPLKTQHLQPLFHPRFHFVISEFSRRSQKECQYRKIFPNDAQQPKSR